MVHGKFEAVPVSNCVENEALSAKVPEEIAEAEPLGDSVNPPDADGRALGEACPVDDINKTAHCATALTLSLFEEEQALQVEELIAPSDRLYVPISQFVQTEVFVVLLNVPSGQLLQPVQPASENVPGMHARHTLAPE